MPYKDENKNKECRRRWYLKNKDRIKKYYENNKEKKREYDKRYRIKNKQKIKERQKQFYEKNKEQYSKKHKEYRLKNELRFKISRCFERIDLLYHISKSLKCARCGCDDYRYLEINHKTGGGKKDFGINKSKFHREIKSNLRNDLELLCRPCNHIHFLEIKFGCEIPLKVVFTGGQS